MSNPVTQEIEAIHREQDAQERATRPSARAHYEHEAALAEPINALRDVMRLCCELTILPWHWGREQRAAIAHAREVLKRWGKV